MPRSSGSVHRAPGGSTGQRELRRVQQLHRQPAADLHLARRRTRCPRRDRHAPPSSARRREPYSSSSPIGVTTLPLDFDIFLRSGSSTQPEIAACVHGSDRVLEMRAQHRREQPGADDVVRLRPQVHRERAGEQVRIALPAADELRRHRRGRPRVHDVGIADEAAGLPALRFGCSRRARRWTDRSAAATRRATAGVS